MRIMDLSDIDVLKKLDEIDSREYSGHKNAEAGNKLSRSNSSDVNFDDFDAEDDDDLADLLYDDDDCSSTKNKSSKQASDPLSPKNTSTKIVESPKSKLFGGPDGSNMFGKRKEQETESSASKKGGIFEKLSENSPKKTPDSPQKPSSLLKRSGKSKIDLFLEDEEKYLGDLGIDQLESLTSTSGFSNEKSVVSPAKSKVISKGSVDLEFDDDALNSLDDMSKITSPAKKSFLDELLKKEPSKPSLKKMSSIFDASPEKSFDKNDGDDVMVYGSYLPTGRSTSRSASGGKQSVKFEDEVRAPVSPPSKASPIKGKSEGFFDKSVLPSRRPRAEGLKSAPPGGRSGIFDNDLGGVLNSPVKKMIDIFSESPKKDQELYQPRPSFKESLNQEDKSGFAPSTGNSRRRGSTAEWLGLGPPVSNPPKPSPGGKKDEINRREAELHNTKPIEPVPSKGGYPWLSDSPAKARRSTSGPISTPNTTPTKQEMRPVGTDLNNSNVPELSKFAEHVVSHSTPHHANANPPNPNLSASDLQSVIRSVPQNKPESVPQNPPKIIPQSAIYNTPQVVPQNVPYLSGQNDAEISSLKALVSSLQFERDQLLLSKDDMTKKKEEDLKVFEETLKKQQKDIEEILERRMKGIQDEHEIELRKLNAELNLLRDERKQLNEQTRETAQKLDNNHEREIKKLKEFHSEAIAMLKRENEDSISRMKRIRDQEIEAISSTQTQAKSLQALSDQLESRASELAALQLKVEDRHHTAINEKESLLAAKEKDLRALEGRLQWQMEEGDHERTRLQQLILRLENRLQLQTKDSEEERWNVQQLKAKLEIQMKFLEEEKKAVSESVDREKEKMRLSQNSLLQEQKTILAQLAQERQQLSSEKLQLEQLSKRVREEEARLRARQLREESNVQNQRHVLDEELEKLRLDKELLKQELLQVRSERNALEREQRQLKDERERFNDMKLELRRRTEEAEHLAMRASSDREDSHTKLVAARRIEADHHLRMNQFTEQMQTIMEKEKKLLLQHEKLAEEARQFEKSKNEALCVNCKFAVGLPLTSLPPAIVPVQPQQSNPRISFGSQPLPPSIDPGMMVWYVTAQKDHAYLEEQLAFMRDLEERRRK